MNKRYIPILITLLFLGITGTSLAQDGGGQKGDKAPRRENRRAAKETMVKVESVVKDENGNPLADVIVSGKEGAIEVRTDANGHFAITVPEKSDILFESEGLESKAVSLEEGPMPATVTMKKAPFLTEDRNKVNIAFGQVTKKELIGAVSTININELKKYDDTQTFADALTGKIPGMIGSTNLRGLGKALVVVDGVPRDPQFLTLNEIDQISVLKDGNSAKLWGPRAQNGVILVTTRRGTAFKRKIEVSVEKGFSTPIALPNYLGSADYFRLYNEASLNDGLQPKYADSTLTHYADGRNRYAYPSLDYYSSEFLKNSKPFQRILTEMSGGNATTQYYANVGWNQTGTLYALGQAAEMKSNRFNMRGNVNFKVNDYIKAAVDAVVMFDMNKQPMSFDANRNPLPDFWSIAGTNHPEYFSPILPISLIRNTPTLNGQVKTARKIYNQYILGGTSTYTNNPYGIMYGGGDQTDNQRTAQVNTSVEADLRNITQGLKFRAFMSFDIYNRYYVENTPTYAIYSPTWARFGAVDSITKLVQTNQDFNDGVQRIPTRTVNYGGNIGSNVTPYFERRFGANAMLDYDRTFNEKHHLTASLLAYWDKFKMNSVLIDAKDAYMGFRAGYDYKMKYMIDFTSTYTNGYHLAPGHMGGYSPSVGIAWNIGEENFLKDSKAVNYLKLRASAGIQDIDPTANMGFPNQEYRPYMESFMPDSYFSYQDGTKSQRSVWLNRSANYNLTFEQMKSANLGLEGYFFNRLLYIDANVFYNRWDNQVVRRGGTSGTAMYPAWVGNNSPYENWNVTDYKGGDLGVTLSKNIGKFYFELGGNILYAISNVVKDNKLYGEQYQMRTGKPVDAIFGLVDQGLFTNATDVFDSPVQKYSPAQPGDIKYQDINKDGKVDDNDQVQIGNSTPRWNYGLNLVLKYGNLSLMATGNGAADYEQMLRGSYFQPQGNDKYSTEVLNRWTPATAATATYPRLSTKTSTNNTASSTFWMVRGDYFRLNRVQLTYDIPRSALKGWPTKEISLYLRGSNLNTWTVKNYQKQLNIGAEPDYRSYAVGVNVLF